MWLRAYGSGHMPPGIWLWAYVSGVYESGHMAPGIGRQVYGSGRTQETVRVQRLVAHDLYVGCPKVWVCAQHLLNREVHRCGLRIASSFENGACVTSAGKLAVKRVHVQRLVNRGAAMSLWVTFSCERNPTKRTRRGQMI